MNIWINHLPQLPLILSPLGTAFVVYEDIFDAKQACDHLSGFNVCNRYLVVLYYQSTKAFKKQDMEKKEEELQKMKQKYNLKTPDPHAKK